MPESSLLSPLRRRQTGVGMEADARPHRLDLLLGVVAAVGGDRPRHAGHDHGGAKVPSLYTAQCHRAPVSVLTLGFADDGASLDHGGERAGGHEAGPPALRIAALVELGRVDSPE